LNDKVVWFLDNPAPAWIHPLNPLPEVWFEEWEEDDIEPIIKKSTLGEQMYPLCLRGLE
jgi:uncharacterized protein with von Willebrand factor type A (vWA) domain